MTTQEVAASDPGADAPGPEASTFNRSSRCGASFGEASPRSRCPVSHLLIPRARGFPRSPSCGRRSTATREAGRLSNVTPRSRTGIFLDRLREQHQTRTALLTHPRGARRVPRLRHPNLEQHAAASNDLDRGRGPRQLWRHQPHLHVHRDPRVDGHPDRTGSPTSASSSRASASISTPSLGCSSSTCTSSSRSWCSSSRQPSADFDSRGARPPRTWAPRAGATGATWGFPYCMPSILGGHAAALRERLRRVRDGGDR